MNTFSVDGAAVAVSGKVPGYDRDEVTARVEALGGRVVASLRAGGDALLVGTSPAARDLWDARERDVPVFHGDLLERVLVDGHVSWSAPEPDGALADAIAQARGLLAAEPTLDLWGEVVELVDACHPERASRT